MGQCLMLGKVWFLLERFHIRRLRWLCLVYTLIQFMSSHFFKQIWSLARTDLCGVINKFFTCSRMFYPINCTSVTLVSITSHASNITQFSPIACCIVLDKMISKVPANIYLIIYCLPLISSTDIVGNFSALDAWLKFIWERPMTRLCGHF